MGISVFAVPGFVAKNCARSGRFERDGAVEGGLGVSGTSS
jgi:hypothetical protein